MRITLSILLLVSCLHVIAQSKVVKLLNILNGHTEPVNCVSFSPNGKYLASGSASKNILSDEGKFEVIVWNTANGKILNRFNGHQSQILDIQFDNLSKRVASVESRGKINIWPLDSTNQKISIDGKDWVSTIRFTLDGKFIIGEYTFLKKICIWDSQTGVEVASLPIDLQIGSMDLSPDGTNLILSCFHKIQIWNLISRKQLLSIDENYLNGFGIKYNKKGDKFSVGLSNGEIKIYNLNDLKLLDTFNGHFKPVLNVDFSYDDRFLVSGSSDQMIKVWDLKSKKEIKSLVNDHYGTVRSVAFSPITNIFATSGDNYQIKLWEIK